MRTNVDIRTRAFDGNNILGAAGILHSSKKSGPPGMSSYHRKSQSLDAATISMQIGQTGSKTNNKSHHSLKERYD